MERNKCLRCDYEWIPRVEKVRVCPRCKNPKWNIAPEEKNKEDLKK